MKKATENLSQDNQQLGQELNLESTEYKGRAGSNTLQCSVNLLLSQKNTTFYVRNADANTDTF